MRTLVELLAVVVVVVGVSWWQGRGHVTGPAPDFAQVTLGGTSMSLAALRGKPTLVAFWAPWCGVCETETGNLSRVRGWVGERANVVSVATGYRSVEEVKAYVARNAVDYPVMLDEGDVAERFNVAAYPTVYFLDAQGQVKGSVVGYTTTLGLWARLMW